MKAADLFAGAGGFSTGARMAGVDVERWRAIDAHPGYEVSDLGRVRSTKAGRVLSTPPAKNGYQLAHIRADGKRHALLVHRLVLIAFVGPCPPGHETSHLDGNRSNNALGNLAWETKRANHARKNEHGTSAKGMRHPAAKLTDSDVIELRRLYAGGGFTYSMLAKRFGVTTAVAGDAIAGRSWAHIVVPQVAADLIATL